MCNYVSPHSDLFCISECSLLHMQGVWGEVIDEAFRMFAILPQSVELTADALILCSLTQDLSEGLPC